MLLIFGIILGILHTVLAVKFLAIGGVKLYQRHQLKGRPTLKELEAKSKEMEKEVVIGADNIINDTDRFIAETNRLLNPPKPDSSGVYWDSRSMPPASKVIKAIEEKTSKSFDPWNLSDLKKPILDPVMKTWTCPSCGTSRDWTVVGGHYYCGTCGFSQLTEDKLFARDVAEAKKIISEMFQIPSHDMGEIDWQATARKINQSQRVEQLKQRVDQMRRKEIDGPAGSRYYVDHYYSSYPETRCRSCRTLNEPDRHYCKGCYTSL